MKTTSHLAEGKGRGPSACLPGAGGTAGLGRGRALCTHLGHPPLPTHHLDGTLPLSTTQRRLAGQEGWAAQGGPWACTVPHPHLQLTHQADAIKSAKLPSDKEGNLESSLNSPELAFL